MGWCLWLTKVFWEGMLVLIRLSSDAFANDIQPGEPNASVVINSNIPKSHPKTGNDLRVFSIGQVPGKGNGLIARFNVDKVKQTNTFEETSFGNQDCLGTNSISRKWNFAERPKDFQIRAAAISFHFKATFPRSGYFPILKWTTLKVAVLALKLLTYILRSVSWIRIVFPIRILTESPKQKAVIYMSFAPLKQERR